MRPYATSIEVILGATTIYNIMLFLKHIKYNVVHFLSVYNIRNVGIYILYIHISVYIQICIMCMSMYMCVYMYVYICTYYIYVYKCVCVHIYIYAAP
jgi:hypothetical protein